MFEKKNLTGHKEQRRLLHNLTLSSDFFIEEYINKDRRTAKKVHLDNT